MVGGAVDWTGLAKKYGKTVVDAIRERASTGERFQYTAAALAAEVDCDEERASSFLMALVGTGLLREEVEHLCPCDEENALSETEAHCDVCVHCDQAFSDVADRGPRTVLLYVHAGQPTRDVSWVLALHGMNTRGAWQEEFSWLVSKTFGYSVPVAIYKYGMVRPGAILKFRQRALTQKLIERVELLSRQIEGTDVGGRPDVIAHSLGTWLLGHALLREPKLKVGRVVLTGSILRPDFDWKSLIDNGQVEAVLCDRGTKDFWAAIAQYFIPDSGPSGRQGFNDRESVVHIRAEGFRHSDFFREDVMPDRFAGIWGKFLSAPLSSIRDLADDAVRDAQWGQAYWPFRATIPRVIVLFVALSVTAFVVASLAIGAWTLIRGAVGVN